MEPDGRLEWDVQELARVLRVEAEDVREYFTDGRRVSFIIERRLTREVVRGRRAPSEGAGFDLLDLDGNKWEVRCITEKGIYFCPSYMVGTGRKFNERGFLRKLGELKGYMVADVWKFPDMPFWKVDKGEVLAWWKAGKLGKTSKISRRKALRLIGEIA